MHSLFVFHTVRNVSANALHEQPDRQSKYYCYEEHRIGSVRMGLDRKVFGFIHRFKIRELFKISRQWLLHRILYDSGIPFDLMVYSKEMNRTKTYFP